MKKKNIIAISGDIAAGKGTVAEILMKKLNYTIYKNGEYFRSLAKEMGMSVTEFNKYVEGHPEIDKQIENRATEYSETHENYIIDARLGWYSVPESFKVYLKVDINEAAKRAFNDAKRKETENLKTIEEQKNDILKRYKLENERYLKIYGIHRDDMNNYDLVIETTNLTPEEVANTIIKEYNNWLIAKWNIKIK